MGKRKREESNEDEDFNPDVDVEDVDEVLDDDNGEETDKEETEVSSVAESLKDEPVEPPKKKRKTEKSKAKSSKAKSSKAKSPKAKSKSSKDKKKTKLSQGEVDAMLKEYFLSQNRPFSLTNVLDNLKTQGLTKKPAEKAIDDLVKKGIVIEKLYGKRKIFYPAQENMEVLDEDEMKQVEVEVKALETEFKTLTEEVSSLEKERKKYKKMKTTDELQEIVDKLTKDVEEARSKLESFENVKLITPEEKEEHKKELQKYVKLWKERKRWCMDIIDMFCGDSVSLKDMLAKVEIEDDKSSGVDMKKITQYL